MDTPNYLRFLTMVSATAHIFSSFILLWKHTFYTGFMLGFYGVIVSIGIILFEHYDKYYNHLIALIPPLEKHTFQGVLLIIFGSLYLGRECEDMVNLSGALLTLCGIFHNAYYYLTSFFNKKYKAGALAFDRPAPTEHDRYDELLVAVTN